MGRRLPVEAQAVELDVTNPEQLATLADAVREHVPHLDGVVHSIGYAPASRCLAETSWEARGKTSSVALHISAYSLKALAAAALPLMPNGGSIVGLTFDGRFAWPVYDWMGVAKAAFEAVNRYLARDLGAQGIRCNLVSAGPLKTTAAKHIPGFDQMEGKWSDRAPLGWDSERHRARGQGRHRAAERLVPRHHRRDDSRRRRRPRDGAVVPLLVLVRHAKAEAPQSGLDDHARALDRSRAGRRRCASPSGSSRRASCRISPWCRRPIARCRPSNAWPRSLGETPMRATTTSMNRRKSAT